jgi:hypothetical protein
MERQMTFVASNEFPRFDFNERYHMITHMTEWLQNGYCSVMCDSPLGPTNEIGFPVETRAGKRHAVTVEQMSLENVDEDESDTFEDINQTQYAGQGKGSDGDDYDNL